MADDDPAVCLIVSKILKQMGHTVEAVHDGQEAIDLFTVCPDYFHLVITDHNMPGVRGLELAGHLRDNGYKGRIVVISGYMSKELERDYEMMDVDKIIEKPFTVDFLSSTFRDLFAQWNQGTDN